MPPVDLQAIEKLSSQVLQGLGYDLVDLEWKHEAGRWVLRVFIDRSGEGAEVPGGISHDDCSRASHALSAELDVADVIHAQYTLEVSSPGLDRPLKREGDFRRFAGKRAKIRTKHPVATGDPVGRRNFAGQLVGAGEGRVRIDVDGRVFELPLADIEKAHLEIEI
jgi:ribosome maturation factor RimP